MGITVGTMDSTSTTDGFSTISIPNATDRDMRIKAATEVSKAS